MEEKPLNEKESLELITQMIRIHRRNGKGKWATLPDLGLCDHCRLIGGVVSACPYRESYWNFLWFAIPIIGFPAMMLTMKRSRTLPRTYIDRVIGYVWIVVGVSALIPSIAQPLSRASRYSSWWYCSSVPVQP